jgi:hypothetical protein
MQVRVQTDEYVGPGRNLITGTAVDRVLPPASLLLRRRSVRTAGVAIMRLDSPSARADRPSENASMVAENVALTVNGQRINSCLSLVVMHADDEIVTIEGLVKGDDLHPMQAVFVHHDRLQCGYCRLGQICSALTLLAEHEAGWPM